MDNYERLGQMVKRERQRQYRTVDKARARVGISRGAWDNVEHGRPVKELTYLAIEQALGWAEGSCEAVLAGGEPTTLSAPASGFTAEVLASDLSETTKQFILERVGTGRDQPSRKTS